MRQPFPLKISQPQAAIKQALNILARRLQEGLLDKYAFFSGSGDKSFVTPYRVQLNLHSLRSLLRIEGLDILKPCLILILGQLPGILLKVLDVFTADIHRVAVKEFRGYAAEYLRDRPARYYLGLDPIVEI